MTPFALSGLLTAMTCFSLSALLLIKAPRSLPNRLLMWFNASVGIWGLGTMMVGSAPSANAALWAWRLAHVGGFPLGMVFYHLARVLCGLPAQMAVRAAHLFALGSVLLCVSGLAMPDVRWMFGSLHYAKANLLYEILFGIWVTIVVRGHHHLWRGFRAATGRRKRQLQVVFYALATGFGGGVTVLLPIFGVALYPYGNFTIPLYAGIVTYAIVKHGFTNTRIVITQAGLLLATYLVVLGGPFILGWWGRSWLERMLGQEWWLVPLGLCTVLATAGPFAYAFLRRQAEAKLLKDQRRYQRTLQMAARGMTQVRNVTKLSTLITRVVSRSVGLTHASLFLWDKIHQRYGLQTSHGPKRLAAQSRYGLELSHPLIRWLQANKRALGEEELSFHPEALVSQELSTLGAGLVVPGFIQEDLVGFLVLGPKRSGEGYSSDDLHAFSTLAHEAAIAIENALSYEELLRVNEQLKAASERLLLQERLAAAGQFAVGMAHEVKNPLSAIKTFAQYLPEKYQDPVFRQKFFRIVQEEIDRINTIVQELSDFAKPAPLDLHPIHLPELLEDTISLLSNQCLKQGVEVRKAFSGNGTVLQADGQQLKQVVLNLILNSLEAMPDGGCLDVSTSMDGAYMKLSIRDTGSGISSEQQKEIWDPFFTTKERGMGLGLAIVRGVVERHGGQIAITSRSGHGTTAEVLLPLAIPT